MYKYFGDRFLADENSCSSLIFKWKQGILAKWHKSGLEYGMY